MTTYLMKECISGIRCGRKGGYIVSRAVINRIVALVSENNAAASAVTAASLAANLKGTSTSSVAIGTGAKSFTTQSGKSFGEGTWLLITSDANETNYMHGYVSTYSGTSLLFVCTNTGGTGTFADWTIQVSGTRGATGPAGGAIADGDYGDITVSSSGATWTIDNSAVTFAKIQDVGGNTFLCRPASSTGVPSTIGIGASQLAGRGSTGNLAAITLGSGLSMSGTTLSAASIGGTILAMVRFDGTGTPSITSQYNVSSITDNGTGDYTINFTSTLANANYLVLGTCESTVADIDPVTVNIHRTVAPTTSACRIQTAVQGLSFRDANKICVVIYGV